MQWRCSIKKHMCHIAISWKVRKWPSSWGFILWWMSVNLIWIRSIIVKPFEFESVRVLQWRDKWNFFKKSRESYFHIQALQIYLHCVCVGPFPILTSASNTLISQHSVDVWWKGLLVVRGVCRFPFLIFSLFSTWNILTVRFRFEPSRGKRAGEQQRQEKTLNSSFRLAN